MLQELRQMLIKGRFSPGEPVRVDQMAGTFGVSPLPVREALRVLVTEGRVEYSAHRGYRVARLSFSDVAENFLMCRLLEAEALRRGVARMGEEGVRRMRALLERLEAPGDVPLWERVAVHQDFHFVPVDLAGLPRMQATLRRLWDHTDHFRSLCFFHDEEHGSLVYQDHHDLVDACAKGDAGLAVAVMDRHRDNVLERVRIAMEGQASS